MQRATAIALVVGILIGLAAIFSTVFGNLVAMVVAGLALGLIFWVRKRHPSNYNARAVIAGLVLVFLVAALISIAGIALTLLGIVVIGVGSFYLFSRLFR